MQKLTDGGTDDEDFEWVLPGDLDGGSPPEKDAAAESETNTLHNDSQLLWKVLPDAEGNADLEPDLTTSSVSSNLAPLRTHESNSADSQDLPDLDKPTDKAPDSASSQVPSLWAQESDDLLNLALEHLEKAQLEETVPDISTNQPTGADQKQALLPAHTPARQDTVQDGNGTTPAAALKGHGPPQHEGTAADVLPLQSKQGKTSKQRKTFPRSTPTWIFGLATLLVLVLIGFQVETVNDDLLSDASGIDFTSLDNTMVTPCSTADQELSILREQLTSKDRALRTALEQLASKDRALQQALEQLSSQDKALHTIQGQLASKDSALQQALGSLAEVKAEMQAKERAEEQEQKERAPQETASKEEVALSLIAGDWIQKKGDGYFRGLSIMKDGSYSLGNGIGDGLVRPHHDGQAYSYNLKRTCRHANDHIFRLSADHQTMTGYCPQSGHRWEMRKQASANMAQNGVAQRLDKAERRLKEEERRQKRQKEEKEKRQKVERQLEEQVAANERLRSSNEELRADRDAKQEEVLHLKREAERSSAENDRLQELLKATGEKVMEIRELVKALLKRATEEVTRHHQPLRKAASKQAQKVAKHFQETSEAMQQSAKQISSAMEDMMQGMPDSIQKDWTVGWTGDWKDWVSGLTKTFDAEWTKNADMHKELHKKTQEWTNHFTDKTADFIDKTAADFMWWNKEWHQDWHNKGWHSWHKGWHKDKHHKHWGKHSCKWHW